MMVIIQLSISLCVLTRGCAHYSDIKHNIITIIHQLNDTVNLDTNVDNSNIDEQNHFEIINDINEAQLAKKKMNYIRSMKKDRYIRSDRFTPLTTESTDKFRSNFRLDPVLNFLGRRAGEFLSSGAMGGSSSSSLEEKGWQTEWREQQMKTKFEALNSTRVIEHAINMVAARPRGVMCGDPNQYDMPWGNCMLPKECEPEYRIYRGDLYCGSTQYICCSLLYQSYDTHQAFDASLIDTSQSSDVDHRQKVPKNESKKKKKKEKKRLKQERKKRKRLMKKSIRNIIREIAQLLTSVYRNATLIKNQISSRLKSYIRDLKEQYKKEKPYIKNKQDLELQIIDQSLEKKMNDIKKFNEHFINNRTFREAVLDGSIKKIDGLTSESFRMLVGDYPGVANYGRRGFKYFLSVHNPDYDIYI